MSRATYVRWTPFELAGVRPRTAAWAIDTGIFATLWAGGMVWLVETGELGTPVRLTAPRAWVWLLVVWVASRIYDAAATHLFGSTVGATIAGLEVRATSGALPGAAASLRRAVCKTPTLVTSAVELARAPTLPIAADPLTTGDRCTTGSPARWSWSPTRSIRRRRRATVVWWPAWHPWAWTPTRRPSVAPA